MTAEDIIDMRDKNCPDWLCDPPTEEYLKKKIAKLESEIKQLQKTSHDSDYAKLKNALEQLVHLHGCEQEGMESGMPTTEQWTRAVDNAVMALRGAKGES